MPLARILTRTPDDASTLMEYLADRGYRVEVADPASLNAEPADLEITLDRFESEDALRLAPEWASIAGGNVYVAPGAFKPAEKPAESPMEISSYVPLTFRQELPSEPVRTEAELEEEDAPVAPGLLDRWRTALAERREAREARKEQELEVARVALEQKEQGRARAAALARERQEQERARIAALAHEQQEQERARRAAALAREQQIEREREQQVRPAIVVGSTVPKPRPAQPPRLQPVLERRTESPRRDAHDEEAAQYWKGAFTGAAVVAAVLMIAWATVATSHPSRSTQSPSQIRQDVPFGPVTLTPSAAARPAAPVAAPATTTPTTPASRSVTPPPKPAPVRSHRTHRSANVAEDEVVVRHYGAPKPAPANATAKNGAPKRITDQ